jgi:hypothetical protein
MVPREFNKAFSFDDHHTHKKEIMTLPPPTITRRIGKIPRSPISQSESQSNEQPIEPPTDTPDTDEDAYENEHTTPTPIRKRPSADIRIPEPSRASSPSLMDVLMAQNMQTMESNRQMMQAFMQTMERLAPSLQASSSSLYPYPPP